LLEIANEGNKIGDSGINGYRGVQVGGSFVGNREDSTYCQISGRHADTFLDRIMRRDLHISRIDLAVTVKFRTMPRHLGEVAYCTADEAYRSLSSSRRRKLWYMSGSDQGYTLYIGSTSSEQRGRLYNKEIQSGTPEYEKSWRYETVYRNARAMAVYEELLTNKQHERPIICSAMVASWWKNRGVYIPWYYNADITIQPQIAEKPSDAANKLVWLAKQVRPALAWLIEHNYLQEALDALGIG